MALTTFASGTTGQTAAGAETTISTINAVGIYRLKVDFNLMAAGDVVIIRRYFIVKTGGTTRKSGEWGFYGAQPAYQQIVEFDEDWNDLTDTDSLKYTIEQPFGTTRALPYAVIKEDNVVTIASGGIISGAHAAAELNSIADAVLDRNMATGTDSGTDSTTTRTPRQALRVLRNKVTDASGTVTVKKEDDSTTSWTAASTRTPSIDTLTAVDPT